jgi:DNA-binding beta-propeller fold protein YncE
MMRHLYVGFLAILLAQAAVAAETLKWVQKPELTFDEQNKKWTVTFELDSLSDVEVAIVDPKTTTVVRHLAAGVLGLKAPPPLIANSRVQRIEWDGRDDYKDPVRNASSMAVRVRAGMSVSLEQIVGGDPYAYYSEEIGDSDHSPWAISGLEAKSDGKVYVWGHSSNLGPPALRQYDVDGNYLQTLFPMPAGKNVNTMKGWGINVRPDGTYTPKFNRLTDPSLTMTFLDTSLHMARLLPTSVQDRLTFWRTGLKAGSFDLMTINTDGTIAEDPAEYLLGPMVKNPPFVLGPVEPNSHVFNSILGPVFVCMAADKKSFYLSGVYAATTIYGSVRKIKMDGFWRDGQVWKVDMKTRTAKVFFALDEQDIPMTRKERTSAYGGLNGYAAIHGVAVSEDGHVFVCDRYNKRIIILDESGKIIREIPIERPDAIALSKRSGALYVTTRHGDYHRRGTVQLLKYKNWRKDEEPTEVIEVSKTGYTRKQTHSYVVVCDTAKGSNVWVAYTQMPVRIYRDDAKGLNLLKDFYRVEGAQRCLGFDRMQVDPKTEDVYVQDAHDAVWKIANWKHPRFVKIPLETASIAIDSRKRHIYARTLRDESSSNSAGKVARFHLDRDEYPPANFGNSGTNRVTPQFLYEWCFEGNSDKGMAVAPNGNLAVVGRGKDGLRLFAGSQSKVPWEATKIANLPNNSGGVRFDLAGNLYVGYVDKKPTIALRGFEGDRHMATIGRIHKYAPTGTLKSGNLFPRAPTGPTHTYDVLYGAFETNCVTRSPRFGVDGYGRIYYPTNIAPRVTVMDNAGNEILHFGTYGNRDSTGGLPGDRIPTKGIPLAFPNSVDATDNYIYVADMVNLRLLRMKKNFRAVASSR